MHDAPRLIRAADWVIAWDSAKAEQVYLRDVDIVFDESGIIHLGARYEGPVGETISGDGLLVMPGLVNIHSHSADEALAKGLFDDVGTAQLYGNALYEFSGLVETDLDGMRACSTVALSELLLSGVTTLVDMSVAYDGWLDLLAQSGARAYAAPLYRQARWRLTGGYRLDYEWDEAAGEEAFAAALTVIDEALAHPCGRLSGMVAPSQVDTCRPALLQASLEAARARGLRLQTHAAQTMAEHDELLRREGQTAPQWLESLGLLADDVILGHCIFLDHHSWTRLRSNDDLALLADRGTSVAHCPIAFARSGMTLESLGSYQRAGVTLGLGTDSYPHNMLEEMRQALLCARIAGKSVFECDSAAVFHAATIGGAEALGRDDIGRLVVGAAADLVLVDLKHPGMRPVYDPLRSLLHGACERAVRHVYIAGRPCVVEGRVVTLDHAGAAEALQVAQQRAIAKVPQHDPRGRKLQEIAPLSLPLSAPTA